VTIGGEILMRRETWIKRGSERLPLANDNCLIYTRKKQKKKFNNQRDC
jgi:dihydrofolate reductase